MREGQPLWPHSNLPKRQGANGWFYGMQVIENALIDVYGCIFVSLVVQIKEKPWERIKEYLSLRKTGTAIVQRIKNWHTARSIICCASIRKWKNLLNRVYKHNKIWYNISIEKLSSCLLLNSRGDFLMLLLATVITIT